jgi:GT2 family glycosyltransferase
MLADCVDSLRRQSFRNFEVIVVDNSGEARVRSLNLDFVSRVIENDANVGFGEAINRAAAVSYSQYIATLNDDAIADPGWLAALVRGIECGARIGMCASQVRLHPSGNLDSAGMLICGDGSSKQRGHGTAAAEYARSEQALLPSGSAALYRRELFNHLGGFDPDFFLYCEDTDFGLRARWAGWQCMYAADAMVDHRYSHSAGRASALKAYYVERNRLAVAIKNFPLRLLIRAPFITVARYFWHIIALFQGQGATGEFRSASNALLLPWFVIRAHFAAAIRLPDLLRKRRSIRQSARVSVREFCNVVRSHYISARRVAAL